MQDFAPTCLKLLAPDGIVQVTFFDTFNGNQSLALLKATQMARTVDDLVQAIKDLSSAWGVRSATEVVCRTPKLPNKSKILAAPPPGK